MDHAGIEEDYVLDGITLQKSCFTLSWVNQLNVDPKIILDIGSYDGGDGIRFKKEFPNSEVYSFEGCPERQKIIEKYIHNYGINLEKFAVTNHSGTTEWYSSTCYHPHKSTEIFSAQGSIYKHTDVYKKTYSHIRQHIKTNVPCVSIGDFGDANNITKIDVMHIDVEGAEYEVLLGLGSIRPTIIYIETINSSPLWINGKNAQDIHNILTNMNYKLIIDIHSDRLYVHKEFGYED